MKVAVGQVKSDGRSYMVLGVIFVILSIVLGMLMPGMSHAQGKNGKNGKAGVQSNQGNGNSGAIWTTRGDCGSEQQNVNHYNIGEVVFINGANFDPGTYSWTIEGLPGNASEDPGLVVASGSFNVGDSGSFCFAAYTVADDDGGEYKVTFGGKHDNYRVPRVKPTDVPPTEVVPTATEVVPTATEVEATEVVPTATEVEGTEVVRTATRAPTDADHPVPNCPEGFTQVKFEDPSGIQTQGPITLVVTRSEEGEPKEVNFIVADGFVVYIVYVKGGPGYRTYDYRPDGVTSGLGLVAPTNPNNGKTYGISHVTFCYGGGATPTATEVVPTEVVRTPTATEVVPTVTEIVPTATEVEGTVVVRTPTASQVVPTATEVEGTVVVPTVTEVLGTVVVRTPTASQVVPTATEVEETAVVATATPTTVIGEQATRTATTGGGEVATATPTSAGGALVTPTAVLGEVEVRTATSGVGGDTGGNVGGAAPTSTSIVAGVGGSRQQPNVASGPDTLPVTSSTGVTQLLQFVICLAIGLMGLGLIMRGLALSQQRR